MNEKVLVVGRSPEMMRRALQSLQDANFQATGVFLDDDALALMRQGSLDALVIGGGVSADDRDRLRSNFRRLLPQGVLYEHSMASKHSLVDGLRQALDAK